MLSALFVVFVVFVGCLLYTLAELFFTAVPSDRDIPPKVMVAIVVGVAVFRVLQVVGVVALGWGAFRTFSLIEGLK